MKDMVAELDTTQAQTSSYGGLSTYIYYVKYEMHVTKIPQNT